MLFEAKMPSLGLSAYRQHEYFEQMFAHMQMNRREQLQLIGYAPRREYTWCQFDDTIYIRRTLPTNDMAWYPLIIPPIASVIGFHLKARPRRAPPPRPTSVRRPGATPTITDPNEAMHWLERRAESYGLVVEDAENDIESEFIERPGITTSGRYIEAFHLAVVNYHGVARIIDRKRFEQALSGGIGDSKAFGFGFMLFWSRG